MAATRQLQFITWRYHNWMGKRCLPLQGGEGVRRLVETREKNKKILGMSVEYW